MSNPRAPGAGTTRAWISLGSGTKPLVAPVDPCFKNCKLCAAILDRMQIFYWRKANIW